MRTFPAVAQTFNQINAATSLRNFAKSAGSDSLSVYRTLPLLDEAPAHAAFDSASGETYTVLHASQQRQRQAAASRFATRALTQESQGWSIWGSVLALDGNVRSEGNGAPFIQGNHRGEMGIGYPGPEARWAIASAAAAARET